MIFELYVTRQHSYLTIADVLNAQGLRTNNWQTHERGRFGRESVRTILGNPAYRGLVSAGASNFKVVTNHWFLKNSGTLSRPSVVSGSTATARRFAQARHG